MSPGGALGHQRRAVGQEVEPPRDREPLREDLDAALGAGLIPVAGGEGDRSEGGGHRQERGHAGPTGIRAECHAADDRKPRSPARRWTGVHVAGPVRPDPLLGSRHATQIRSPPFFSLSRSARAWRRPTRATRRAGNGPALTCPQADPCSIADAVEDAAVADGDVVLLAAGTCDTAGIPGDGLDANDAITIRPVDPATRPLITAPTTRTRW